MKKWWGQMAMCACLIQAALAAEPPVVTPEPSLPSSTSWSVSLAGQGSAHAPVGISQDTSGNELSYGAYIDSTSRLKCLYGYAAEKVGDHAAAIRIFEDCIARWEDVYSMIWLAMMHENGTGLPRDLGKAVELMRRGALSPQGAGYATLARYHYGVALHQGRGVPRDEEDASHWLARASAEGQGDAAAYLQLHFPQPPVR
ncbi:MAG: sel1 repeat family protein [Pseudomonadota bacterium]|nr:sel1 repeat family protein [Pseudomonadota bacterium]